MRSGAGGGASVFASAFVESPCGQTMRITAAMIASTAIAMTITGQLFHDALDVVPVAGMRPVVRGGKIPCDGSSLRTARGTGMCAFAGCCGLIAWPFVGPA
jgi:hypothetical protein